MAGGHRLLVTGMVFTNPDGKRFLVESGAAYDPIENILHGLLVTLGIYMPLAVSLAIVGGYWLMRRSLRPVDEITKRAQGITSTNLSERLPIIKTGDELERLSTALNHMIARLDDAFQHINRFSADASHELRTPLTILQLELEGMIQHYRLDPELVDQIGSALEETHRLSRIVENLLVISRLDAGEVQIEKIKFDLGELAVSTVDQMKLLAEEKLLSMQCHAARGVYIEADQARLKQVIVNLIDNAIKYTPPGGRINIDVGANQHSATVEVSDSGVGISAEVLPHVFERFYRADKARSRDSGGAGLGLAIVKAICTALGAEIRITSTEGLGSRFIVSLPLAPSHGGESPNTTKVPITVSEER
jgi:heavy metal sensor kinase